MFDVIPTNLTEEQDAIRAVVRDMARSRLAPMVAEIDRTDAFPEDAVKELRALNLFALSVPVEFGGDGADVVTECLVVEELAYAFPAAALTICPSIVLSHIFRAAGDSPARERYSRRQADENALVGICLTESGAGSDSASIRTAARQVEGGWVLDGTKLYVTNGSVADFYCVFARTGTTEERARGISAFMVEASNPGLGVGRVEDKMGIRGSKTAELTFDSVFVATEDVVGEIGHGFEYVMRAFDTSRPVIGVLALGLASSAMDLAAQHASVREQFGQSVGSFQGVQFLLADMAIGIQSARALVYEVARVAGAGMSVINPMAAMAKCYATDVAMKVTTDAVQVLGGAGYIKDGPAERMMRDAKIFQIFEGTNQIQRLIVGKHINDMASSVARSGSRR
jgi:alkylation response protein AidB-like acyl-CoA dehydrogenase